MPAAWPSARPGLGSSRRRTAAGWGVVGHVVCSRAEDRERLLSGAAGSAARAAAARRRDGADARRSRSPVWSDLRWCLLTLLTPASALLARRAAGDHPGQPPWAPHFQAAPAPRLGTGAAARFRYAAQRSTASEVSSSGGRRLTGTHPLPEALSARRAGVRRRRRDRGPGDTRHGACSRPACRAERSGRAGGPPRGRRHRPPDACRPRGRCRVVTRVLRARRPTPASWSARICGGMPAAPRRTPARPTLRPARGPGAGPRARPGMVVPGHGPAFIPDAGTPR